MKAQENKVFFSIPVSLYQADELIDRDLYLLYQGDYLLFRPKNMVWTKEDTQRLAEFQVEDLYIKCVEEDQHYKFLEENIRKVLDSRQLDSKRKSMIMYETSETMMKQVFDRANSPSTVKRSVSMVKNSIDFLKDKQNFYDLMSMASANFSEYTHAVQVSAYAITLAKEMGLKSFNELSAIGIGALLHDIGKTKVDSKILGKHDILTEDERFEVRKHPAYGYEILHKQRSVPEMAEHIVLQHHERSNGSGYPYKLGEEMSMAARVVALADCFDSLTSHRPWKNAMSAIDAVKFMSNDCDNDYDRNLLVGFIKVLGIK